MHTSSLRLFALFALLGASQAVVGASKVEIDAKVKAALSEFYSTIAAGEPLAKRAKGILVFPSVIKAGLGLGGEFGEGALLVGGATHSYYNIASASIGFQLGAQVKKEVILFMSEEALAQFISSDGWEAGVDGSVALAEWGAGEQINTNTVRDPIIGFIFSNKGLMYNLTFEGSKITRIHK